MTLPVPTKILDQIVAVLAKTRSGKSSVLRLLAEYLLDHNKPVCIIDPKGDWWGLKLSEDGRGPGYPIVIFGGEHADLPLNEHAGGAIAEIVATGNRPCLLDLKGWMPSARSRFWIDFASTLFRLNRGQRWLFADEFHNFAPKGRSLDPLDAKALHWSNRLASEGLGLGVNLVFASQRPQKVHNDVLTSAETLIAMRVLHPSDREAISDWIDGCGDRKIGAEVLSTLAQLQRGEGWVWSPEIGFGPKRISFPKYKTYDSFKPPEPGDDKRLTGWASVNLDEVRSRLATVIEEAKANDPASLKARIADLEAQLREASAAGEDHLRSEIGQDDLETAKRESYNAGSRDTAATARSHLGETAICLQAAVDHLKGALSSIDRAGLDVGKLGAFLDAGCEGQPSAPAPYSFPVRITQTPRPAPAPKPGINGAGASDEIGKSRLRRMMIALAQCPKGLSTSAIGVRASISSKSGTFDTYLSRARTNGWIDGSRDLIVITPAGRAALGSYEPLPKGRALLAYWVAELGKGGASRMLQAAAAVYPRALSKAELGERANISSSSGSFDTYLSKLRRLELLRGKSELTASADLFA